jgi:hypothetical protein
MEKYSGVPIRMPVGEIVPIADIPSDENSITAEIKEIANKNIVNKSPLASNKSLSNNSKSSQASLKIDHQSQSTIEEPKKPAEFYDKIISGLSNKENFDRQALIDTIDVALNTLHSFAHEEVKGITVQINASDHIIVYEGKNKNEKTIHYSGIAQPTKMDKDYFIAQGTFGLVQKAGSKALKTIRQDKGPRAKKDIMNSISQLKSLHMAHPTGRVPNLETTPKHILVGVLDPKTNELMFIDGGLSPRYDADLDSIGPDEYANFPDMQMVLSGYADIFGVLDFMHQQDVTHGDIKPGNIFIKNGTFYLGDFGSVWKVSEWNQENYIMGTTQYMPVDDAAEFEQAYLDGNIQLAKTIRQKMDVFALAASAFETITGCEVYGELYKPSDRDNDYVNPKDYAEDAYDILEAIADQYSPEVKEFFLKALSPNRDERPTPIECQKMLRKILNP